MPEVVLEVLRRFDQTILTICEGQFLDLSFEGDLRISEADYLAMISRKTAALAAAAAGLGAIVGGADAATPRRCLISARTSAWPFRFRMMCLASGATQP